MLPEPAAVAASEGAEATTTAEAVVHLRDALDSMLTGAARRELSTLAAQSCPMRT